MASVRFPIRFERWYAWLSRSLLIPPELSFVEVSDEEVAVRMAWAFAAHFPRSAVASTDRRDTFTPSRGVHGWNGRWLVNGAGSGLLSIELVPARRARVVGMPVRLRQLIVSVDDRDGLVDALR